MTFWERKALAQKSYRPAKWDMAVDSDKLRTQLFDDNHIPKDVEEWRYDVPVPLKKGGTLMANVLIKRSKSVGDRQCRGGRGHRMFIQCPACVKEGVHNPIPIGRLHQHYGYKHADK